MTEDKQIALMRLIRENTETIIMEAEGYPPKVYDGIFDLAILCEKIDLFYQKK